MDEIGKLRPAGLVTSPAFSHVAVIPPCALVRGDDVAARTAQVMDNLRAALAGAGATTADLVAMSILVVDGIELSATAAVLR